MYFLYRPPPAVGEKSASNLVRTHPLPFIFYINTSNPKNVYLESPKTALPEAKISNETVRIGRPDAMRPPLRIALLECNELVGEVKRQHGSSSNVYKWFLEAGASKLAESGVYERPKLAISFYNVVKKQDYPDIGSIDAVFITGSGK
jgi:hypothetical protein